QCLVAERRALAAPVAGRGGDHHVSARARLVGHASDQLPADAVTERSERQLGVAPREGFERRRHVEPAPLAHARALRGERCVCRDTDAPVVVHQGVIAALGTVGGKLKVELAPEAGGAIDAESTVRRLRLEQQAAECAPISRLKRERLRGCDRTQGACCAITAVTALMAARRGVVLRHTAPTCRAGAGRTNGRSTTPRPLRYDPRPASSGSSVTPAPAATIWRKVSRLVARKARAARTATRLHTSSASCRRQCPSSSSSSRSFRRSATRTRSRAASG